MNNDSPTGKSTSHCWLLRGRSVSANAHHHRGVVDCAQEGIAHAKSNETKNEFESPEQSGSVIIMMDGS